MPRPQPRSYAVSVAFNGNFHHFHAVNIPTWNEAVRAASAAHKRYRRMRTYTRHLVRPTIRIWKLTNTFEDFS